MEVNAKAFLCCMECEALGVVTLRPSHHGSLDMEAVRHRGWGLLEGFWYCPNHYRELVEKGAGVQEALWTE